MNLTPDIMLLNFTAPESALILYADAIIYLNPPSCVGIRGMIAKKENIQAQAI